MAEWIKACDFKSEFVLFKVVNLHYFEKFSFNDFIANIEMKTTNLTPSPLKSIFHNESSRLNTKFSYKLRRNRTSFSSEKYTMADEEE